ncbi:MAG: N-acetyltransferase [Balneolaceae bacterium]
MHLGDYQIRNEAPSDAKHIHQVTELAFKDAPHSDHTEQFIVKSLRESGALTVSLVAELEGEIIGHVAISPVSITDGSDDWYGLGPISVLPEYQGKGVGSKLMKRALADLDAKGALGCVVLGDPAYYARFGFKVIEGLTFPDVPPEYFQALSFNENFPQGDVTYQKAFSAKG